MNGEIWAVVVAGGAGRRFGGPKQLEFLRGRRVLDWAVEGARSVADGVVLVLPAGLCDQGVTVAGVDVTVPGGETRAQSVRCGLAVVPESARIIVVHDAARPLASKALFHSVVEAVQSGSDGAVPGLAVADTLKSVVGDRVVATVDRSHLVAVQTPQAFAARTLREAHCTGSDATDDAGLVEGIGGAVVVVPGEARNMKLTSLDDLDLLASWWPE